MSQTTPVKAACYCRISSDPKDRREGVSRQRDDTTALCEIKGWTPAGYYIDNDRSASNGNARPEWDRLLADVKAGQIDAIAAWDQDRGWRMMHELEELRRFFTALGREIPLATTGQGDIDLYSPTGVLAAQIKTAVSEHEIAMMKVRMRRAARQRAEDGIPKWKRAFGYRDDTRQPDPLAAPMVKRAYKDIIAGGSISDIAREWNQAGAYGLKGQPWTPSTVSLFLRAHRNAGLRAHNGVEVGKGNWPGLVDVDTWRAAQTVLNAPGRGHAKTVQRHLLTGLLLCGKPGCDGYLSGSQTIDKRIAYACKACRGCSVRAEYVEPMIHDLVIGRLAQPDAVDLLRAAQHDTEQAESTRAELGRLYAKLDQLAVERAEELLTARQVKISSDIINEKITTLEAAQHDQDRLRVFDGIPLGTPEVDAAIRALSPDRFRAVLDVLGTLTVAPVGKGRRSTDGGRFDPDRITWNWI